MAARSRSSAALLLVAIALRAGVVTPEVHESPYEHTLIISAPDGRDPSSVGPLVAAAQNGTVRVRRHVDRVLAGGCIIACTEDGLAYFQALAAQAELLVEESQRVHAYRPVKSPAPRRRLQGAPPSWGLDRIDGSIDSQPYAPAVTGVGAHIFILDTGVHESHTEFSGGRIGRGQDMTTEPDGSTQADILGHGTHCAGTAGGNTVGVATGATIHGVKVIGDDGIGFTSDTIAGMEWVMQRTSLRPAVISMSLGGGFSHLLNLAVRRLYDAGIVTVVAAGNFAQDACSYSPASAPEAITVGATTASDTVASYSNTGACVDIWAPGSDIYSSVPCRNPPCTQSEYRNHRYDTFSGTSMACPHVAGVVAQVFEVDPLATPAQVLARIQSAAISGVPGSKASPNRLLLQMAGSVTDWDEGRKASFANATAEALGVREERVLVTGVTAASVRVTFMVVQVRAEYADAKGVREKLADVSSPTVTTLLQKLEAATSLQPIAGSLTLALRSSPPPAPPPPQFAAASGGDGSIGSSGGSGGVSGGSGDGDGSGDAAKATLADADDRVDAIIVAATVGGGAAGCLLLAVGVWLAIRAWRSHKLTRGVAEVRRRRRGSSNGGGAGPGGAVGPAERAFPIAIRPIWAPPADSPDQTAPPPAAVRAAAEAPTPRPAGADESTASAPVRAPPERETSPAEAAPAPAPPAEPPAESSWLAPWTWTVWSSQPQPAPAPVADGGRFHWPFLGNWT